MDSRRFYALLSGTAVLVCLILAGSDSNYNHYLDLRIGDD